MMFRMENERIFLFIVFYRQTDSNRSKTWFRSYKNVASIRVFASLNFQSSWAEQQYIIRKWQRKRATYTTIVNINFVMCGTESTSTHTHTHKHNHTETYSAPHVNSTSTVMTVLVALCVWNEWTPRAFTIPILKKKLSSNEFWLSA